MLGVGRDVCGGGGLLVGNNPIMMNDPLGDISGGRYSQADVALFNAILNWNNRYEVERMSAGMQNSYFIWHSTNYPSPWCCDGGIGGNAGGLKAERSGAGWPTKVIKVHQTAIKNYFSIFKENKNNLDTKLEEVKIKALTDAALLADSDQSGASAFKHAMRTKFQTPQTAMRKADQFVREQFKKAKQYLSVGNIYQAYMEFGLGLHALQDATSPAHYGFQLWTGSESDSQKFNHHLYESFYPGLKSNLQKVTNLSLDWLENGGQTSLPSINLFKLIEKDSVLSSLLNL